MQILADAVADELRGLHAKRGMSIDRLAELTGVPADKLHRKLKKKTRMDVDHAWLIAHCLGADLVDVLAAALDEVGESLPTRWGDDGGH